MIGTSEFDRGFAAALQTRSHIAKEAGRRAAVAEKQAQLLKRALIASGIVSAVFAATTWWLLLWWLAE
jgi:hypothetical protein